MTLPSLFLSHGAPTLPITDTPARTFLTQIGSRLPKPKAILVVSAHWETDTPMVNAVESNETIHDFRGFPRALYDLRYPAPGSPQVAARVAEALHSAGFECRIDHRRGLDHGAWSVLKHLYPAANIPVIQLSIDYTQPASFHFALGQQLQDLRRKGILIIGSGNIVHNLRLVDFENFDRDNYGFDWAIEARAFINTCLVKGDFEPLIHYAKQSKALQMAIPSPDHFLPLLYTLGLQQKGDVLSLFNDKLLAGSLSMTSVKIS